MIVTAGSLKLRKVKSIKNIILRPTSSKSDKLFLTF